MYKGSLSLLLFIVLFTACGESNMPKSDEGFPYTYLLNTHEYLRTQLHTFGKINQRFIQVTPRGKLMDTAYISGVNVDWKFYVQPFLDIDMHQPKYDSVYSMSQEYNEKNAHVDIKFTALYDNLPMNNMQILLDGQTNEIYMIYAESQFNKPWHKTHQFLLYKPGKLIQIRTSTKKWFGKNENITRTLYFPANDYNKPSATIN